MTESWITVCGGAPSVESLTPFVYVVSAEKSPPRVVLAMSMFEETLRRVGIGPRNRVVDEVHTSNQGAPAIGPLPPGMD